MSNRIISSTKPSRSGAGSGIAGVTVSINEAAFTTAAAELINKSVRKFNRSAPNVFRNSIREAISSDALFGSQWAGDWINRLKSEQRDVGQAKRGSGIRIKFSNNTFELRINVSRGFVEPEMGRDGAFYFISHSFGTTGGFIPAREKAYPIAIKGAGEENSKTYDGALANYDNKIVPQRRDGRTLIFLHGPILIDAIVPSATWPSESTRIAEENISKLWTT